MANKYTYTEAFSELQHIVSDIEAGEINVDELAEKIQRAALLIEICKAKLTHTEEEVDKLLDKLRKEQNAEPPQDDAPADGDGAQDTETSEDQTEHSDDD